MIDQTMFEMELSDADRYSQRLQMWQRVIVVFDKRHYVKPPPDSRTF